MRIFDGLAGTDALHDQVAPSKAWSVNGPISLARAADRDVAAVLPAERFGARLAHRAVAQGVEVQARFLAEKRLTVGQDRRVDEMQPVRSAKLASASPRESKCGAGRARRDEILFMVPA